MKNYFKDISYTHQLVLLVLTVLVSWIIFTLLGSLFAIPIWGTESLSNPETLLSNHSFLKYFQIIQTFALFIIPSLTFSYITGDNSLNKNYKAPQFLQLILLTIVVVIISQPFISTTGILNNNLSLPDYLSNVEEWMREKELTAEKTTEIFLHSNNWSQTVLNVLIIAIFPAIGEELLFRKSIQSILIGIFKNSHLAIFITAALFSAIHIQFFGFLPRLTLGLIFGYLLLYSKNIWLPILAHFVNNFMAYIIYQRYANDIENLDNPLHSGESYPSLYWIILSMVGVIALLSYIKRITTNN